MGLIQIENMEFYSFHGHFKEERIVGNKFLVDLTIETDMKAPAVSDNLKDAVNYQRVYDIVKSQMELKSHLLEHIAGRIPRPGIFSLLKPYSRLVIVLIIMALLGSGINILIPKIIAMELMHIRQIIIMSDR
jgi:dihydroneopterin aldolase